MNVHPRGTRDRLLGGAAVLVLTVGLAACADFGTEPTAFTDQPTLTAAGPRPQDPQRPFTSPTPGESSSTAPETSGSSEPDECTPTDPAVVAACLDAPWGLAVLPDGLSALVGERTTGRLMRVAKDEDPVEVAVVKDLDTDGSGGLLGIALSPTYAEDSLVYLYVTTATDNRILRLAGDDTPKAIFTGIPKGEEHNGGRIAFGVDGYLYIATGDAGDQEAAAEPDSLAGKILRIDEFGEPAGPDGESAVHASGLTDPTGLYLLPTGRMGVVEQQRAADVLIEVVAGDDLSQVDPLWTYDNADGGAVDCAAVEATITTTSLDAESATSLTLTPSGAFAGEPVIELEGEYGRLLSAAPGAEGAVWLTTSNKDGSGEPSPADDLVLVLPNAGGSGGGVD